MKMYYRNHSAVVFSLIFPLALLGVFGFLSRSANTSFNIALTSTSESGFSRTFVDAIKGVSAFKIEDVSETEGAKRLDTGDAVLHVVIPREFGVTDTSTGKLLPARIETRYNASRPQNGQVASLIIGQIASGMNAEITGTPEIISVTSTGVQTSNLGYFDFILPGILAMVIMQAGLFGVAFAFVSFKASGSLRRLQATPTHPLDFVIAQAITRLFIILLTVAILTGFGAAFFDFHMQGSYVNFAIVSTLGILIFLGFGFIIAGVSKDENQVAPLANVVQLPMLFLSGVFFPRSSFPEWLQRVTDFFPLTYLSDALRLIANEGRGLLDLGWSLAGLVVWCVIVFAAAVRAFRWE